MVEIILNRISKDEVIVQFPSMSFEDLDTLDSAFMESESRFIALINEDRSIAIIDLSEVHMHEDLQEYIARKIYEQLSENRESEKIVVDFPNIKKVQKYMFHVVIGIPAVFFLAYFLGFI